MDETKQYHEVKESAPFTAEGTWTLEMLHDLQKAWTPKRIVLLCMLFFSIALCIFNLFTQYLGGFVTALYLFLSIFLAVVLFVSPHTIAKRQYDSQLVTYGGELRVLLCFTEQGIEQYNLQSGGHHHWDYLRIQKLQKTKLCYFLWMEKSMVLLFCRGHLKKGTEAQFDAFLAEKCPYAKRNFLKD